MCFLSGAPRGFQSSAATGASAEEDEDLKQRVARVRVLETANADLRKTSHSLQSQLEAAAAKNSELQAKLSPPTPAPLTAAEESKLVASEAFRESLSRSLKLVERTLWAESAGATGSEAAAAAAALAADYTADPSSTALMVAQSGGISASAAALTVGVDGGVIGEPATAAVQTVLHLPKVTRYVSHLTA